MYVKIQKDLSDTYILLEATDIELCFFSPNTTYMNYIRNFLSDILAPDVALSVHSDIGEQIKNMFGVVDFLNLRPATNYTFYDCKEGNIELDCSCSIKGVKVNGTYYVTCGNIYVMNDKGQTIQKI